MPLCKEQDFWIQQSTKDCSFESQYELGKELGRGATSCVYKCQRRGLPKTWAVKILAKNVKKRVTKADVGILLRLDHKNLVRFKEVFESRSRIFIVQELVTGGELFERVVTVGEYSEAVASRAVRDVIEGVGYLHRCGYAHRNLKPGNLLYENLSADSPLKISDFALSSVLKSEVDMSSVCGSPIYAAPELLKGERTSFGVDMWAIGVITFILLGGKEPFQYDSPAELFKHILKGDYQFLRTEWHNIGSNAKDFIRKLLVVDPKKRLTAEAALCNCWVNGVGASFSLLPDAAKRIMAFNEQRKSKRVVLEVSSTPRSRAVSRGAPSNREMSPLPGVDPEDLREALLESQGGDREDTGETDDTEKGIDQEEGYEDDMRDPGEDFKGEQQEE